MNRNSLLAVFFFMVYAGCLSGQPFEPYDRIKFQKITQKNGLSHSNIECIFQDSDGFMWFGTRNGLCRYDGYEIKVYRSSDDRNPLSGDRIMAINEDRKGNIWIGTLSNGLNKLNKKSERITGYSEKILPGKRINRIKVFRNGSVWVCTSDGLARYLPGKDSFIIYRVQPGNPRSINSNNIYDVLETKKGEVYIATEADPIQKLDTLTGEFSNLYYKRNPELNNNYRKRIVEDNQGLLWISANVHGLCCLNPSTGKSEIYVKAPNQLSTNVLNGDMVIGPEGNLWISTDGGGIDILNVKTRVFSYIRSNHDDAESLSSDHVYTVYFDDRNTLWVGTFDEGIDYYNPDNFKFNSFLYKPGDLASFSKKSVLSIYQDKKQRLWIGTDGEGLFMFDTKGRLHSFHRQTDNANSIPTNVITSINEDLSGHILIGTYAGGLASFDVERNVFTCYNNAHPNHSSISSENVWQIFPDSRKRIWLGLLGTGIDLFDPANHTFTNYGPASSGSIKIPFENVMAIMEDSDGDIWFGTEGKGIFILDKETAKVYRLASDTSRSYLVQGIIKSLCQDHLGYTWIGTEGDGLYRFDKKYGKSVHYTEKNGLPNNIVQSISEDRQGNLWLGTSNGLGFFNTKNGTFRQFVMEDGLSGNEFNPDALVQLADGRFAAGTSGGIDIFRPEGIRINQHLPRVVITRLEVMNQEVYPGESVHKHIILGQSITCTRSIRLSYRDKTFSLEFAALNYISPDKCQYRYKLEGFDDGWINIPAGRRRVSYSNLEPGDYIFRVKASNNEGKWGNNERTLQIRIPPPFYKTMWFRLILILFLLSVIFSVYRYRLNIHKNRFRQKQIEQERKIMLLEKEKLESELQKLTFHILNRNRALIDQKNRLLGLSVKTEVVVKNGLLDIISKINEELTDDKDWTFIEPQLDKVYNNFVTRLKERFPDLTLSEIKIAAYIRMNLSTKEISEFMHKTTHAVENDRYRLRKKIGLDLNDSLQNFLINL